MGSQLGPSRRYNGRGRRRGFRGRRSRRGAGPGCAPGSPPRRSGRRRRSARCRSGTSRASRPRPYEGDVGLGHPGQSVGVRRRGARASVRLWASERQGSYPRYVAIHSGSQLPSPSCSPTALIISRASVPRQGRRGTPTRISRVETGTEWIALGLHNAVAHSAELPGVERDGVRQGGRHAGRSGRR